MQQTLSRIEKLILLLGDAARDDRELTNCSPSCGPMPTAPACARRSAGPGTALVFVSSSFQRDERALPYADRFELEV